jgi:ketosteroid isomerase-like protein
VPTAERDILDFGFDAFNRGDFDAAVTYFAPEIVWRDPSEVPDAGEHHGPDEVKGLWRSFAEQWTDMRMDPLEFAEDGDRTLVRVHFSGKGRESGAPMELEFFQLWTIRESRALSVDSFISREAAEEALRA